MSEKHAITWITSDDTGVSSRTIWGVMMGAMPSMIDVPHDPSDFGRCHRLLTLMPEWKARLGEVADALPAWGPLVKAWDELETLYCEECGTGFCRKLYNRMQELIDEGRRADGWVEIDKGYWRKSPKPTSVNGD